MLSWSFPWPLYLRKRWRRSASYYSRGVGGTLLKYKCKLNQEVQRIGDVVLRWGARAQEDLASDRDVCARA